MSAAIAVNGSQAIACNVQVPNVGAWVADVDFDGSVKLSGKVELTIGAVKFSGTIDPAFSGLFQLSRKIRIVAGANGWQTILPAKQYNHSLGVKPSHILNDIAGAVGEVVVVADDSRLGVDWIRMPGPASRTLRQLSRKWWVDYAGVTQTKDHPTADASAYDLLHYDARYHVAELAVDDLSKVVVGSVLRGRLDVPQTVRALEIKITKDTSRMLAWGFDA